MGLLRGVDWNILLGKGNCGGHTLLSFPVAQPNWISEEGGI